MTKQENIENPDSCWNKADLDELLFVILERDPAAPATVRFWCDERIRQGLNHETDAKIQNAREIASKMNLTDRKRVTNVEFPPHD